MLHASRFRLSQLPLRKNDLLALPRMMLLLGPAHGFTYTYTHIQRTHAAFPLLFFSRPSRWKPSAHGRDRSTCTDLHISRGLFENRSDVFVPSYIITFLKRIGIFMPRNEVVMGRTFVALRIHNVSACHVCVRSALSYETVAYLAANVVYFTRYEMFHVGGTYLRSWLQDTRGILYSLQESESWSLQLYGRIRRILKKRRIGPASF